MAFLKKVAASLALRAAREPDKLAAFLLGAVAFVFGTILFPLIILLIAIAIGLSVLAAAVSWFVQQPPEEDGKEKLFFPPVCADAAGDEETEAYYEYD